MNIIRTSIALVLMVGAGLVHGAWNNRWRPSSALTAMSERIASVPMVIGDWKATSSEIGPRELAMAGAVGYFSRRYTSQSRGITVSVVLLCGLPGDISTHTPDVCYPGAGFILDSSSPYELHYGGDGQQQATFRTAVATRGGTSPSILRIFWGWNASKGWTAPEEPRWTFGSEPALCKLYVIRETAGTAFAPKDDPSNDFWGDFLPELDRVVFYVAE